MKDDKQPDSSKPLTTEQCDRNASRMLIDTILLSSPCKTINRSGIHGGEAIWVVSPCAGAEDSIASKHKILGFFRAFS
ncbi:hypothetical protein RRG08_025913 [Elysia crispata]|uniref:Uncharacterized protein n=1 Tax=Elysia crispata TaxID=231223 RepID=A0AAE1AH69_9GAST|nr:hypothetical protein RRG08_025913 [Elysia crispata]